MRCVLIVQDLQNDVMIDGGAFAESGLARAREGAERRREREGARGRRAASKGIPVIHVHYIVEDGAPGLKLNAPLFQGVKDTGGLVRGTWGAAPAEGLEPQDGDFIVEKMRMSAWQGTRLENLLAGLRPRHDHRHRRLDEHVHRAHVPNWRGQGLLHGRARGRLLDDERRLAQRVHQLRASERVDRDDVRRGHGGARRSPCERLTKDGGDRRAQ